MQNLSLYHTLQTIKSINEYQIKNHILGKGSSATTYLCLKKDSLIPLACKMIIKSDLDKKIIQSSSTEAQQIKTRDYLLNSLRKQIGIWKELQHENVVRFVDVRETKTNLYFFLEYCDSMDLSVAIRKGLTQEQGLKYLFDIAKGVLYLYKKGVYHRDLKPQNILIHQGRAKIADFGFSKVMQQAETKDKPKSQTTVGTPNYMAIQILEGSKYSIKCDIWSFGVMIYKMFYGILPWENPKSIEHLKKQAKLEIKFPKVKGVQKELEELIRGMIVVDEQDRLGAVEVYERVKSMYEGVYGKVMEVEEM